MKSAAFRRTTFRRDERDVVHAKSEAAIASAVVAARAHRGQEIELPLPSHQPGLRAVMTLRSATVGM
jgi:hypothetical protein